MNQTTNRLKALFTQHPWLPFVLPMAIFMLIGSLEPKPNADSSNAIPYSYYPWVYAVKLIATLASLAFVWPWYKSLAQTIRWKGIAVGIAGGIVWIYLCNLNWEQTTLLPLLKTWGLESLLGSGVRSAFNPFEEWKDQRIATFAYLALRGFGLIFIVPIIEEYFLRGFVMRYIASEHWTDYPIGRVTAISALVGTLLPMLMHPGELLAAAVWFSMISLLAWHTKNLWECIAAHSATNLILGIYVLTNGAWWLV